MTHRLTTSQGIRRAALIGVLGTLSLVGCAGSSPARTTQTAAATLVPAGHITHVVLFTLADGTDEDAFLTDCRDLLGPIPGVTSLTCGRHLETGRSIVLGDYDVGVSVGLASEAAYQDYLAHPKHLELLDRWGSTIASYRIFDIQESPSR